MTHSEARVPAPAFAFMFLDLCVLNSAIPYACALSPVYLPIKGALVEAVDWGLLLAIAALGHGTSVETILGLGWRHLTTVLGTTAVIFVVVSGGLLLVHPG